jgi:hypothetical protein
VTVLWLWRQAAPCGGLCHTGNQGLLSLQRSSSRPLPLHSWLDKTLPEAGVEDGAMPFWCVPCLAFSHEDKPTRLVLLPGWLIRYHCCVRDDWIVYMPSGGRQGRVGPAAAAISAPTTAPALNSQSQPAPMTRWKPASPHLPTNQPGSPTHASSCNYARGKNKPEQKHSRAQCRSGRGITALLTRADHALRHAVPPLEIKISGTSGAPSPPSRAAVYGGLSSAADKLLDPTRSAPRACRRARHALRTRPHTRRITPRPAGRQ